MSKNKKISAVLYHLLIFGIGLLMIYPIAWMIISSFKDNNQILNHAGQLLPEVWHFENWTRGWAGFMGNSFAVFFKNSFFISLISTIATVFSSAMVAYAFARVRFRGRKLWFGAMMASMMLPGQVIMVPQFIIWTNLKLVGTYAPLIIPHFFGSAFFIYQMMMFVRTLPRELDEAAYIDGCNKYQVFFKIVLPLIKPSLITTFIIQFYWKWDDFMGPLLYLNRTETWTVSLALKNFADTSGSSDYGAMFAMATLSLIPVFAIFLFFNRHLVEGMSRSGIKG